MVDKDSIVTDDLPSMDFLLNPYFFRLLNENKIQGCEEYYNAILEYTDDFHEYELCLITNIDTGDLFNDSTGTVSGNVTLLDDNTASVFLKTTMTEYGFYVTEQDSMEILNLGEEDVHMYGWVIKDTTNDFVLLYSIYDEPIDVCEQLFLDEGGFVQIKVDILCEVQE